MINDDVAQALADDKIVNLLQVVVQLMQERKPQERGDVTRLWAICLTDTQKLLAVWQQWFPEA